jgi:hypothetical protein
MEPGRSAHVAGRRRKRPAVRRAFRSGENVEAGSGYRDAVIIIHGAGARGQEPSPPPAIGFPEETSQVHPMQENRAENENRSRASWRGPLMVAIAVAVFGMLAMLIVDHGPWSRPQVRTAEVATYRTTGEAARAVGASVTPTAPKAAIEPAAPGPKAQPNNPVMP